MSDNAPIIFGSVNNVNRIKKSKGIKIEEPDKSSIKPVSEGHVFSIGFENGTSEITVTKEEFDLLDNVLIRDDPEEVFMQEDVSFYDSYYLTHLKIDDTLTLEARKIRRVYRNYTKYLYACYIRDKYMDSVMEQYSEDDGTVLGCVDNYVPKIPDSVFIPPEPMYSRNAEDYDKVMSGGYSFETPFEEPTEEEIEELLQTMVALSGRDPKTQTFDSGEPLVYLPAINDYENHSSGSSSSRYSGPSSVSVADLDALQKIIKSWHKPENTVAESTKNRVKFANSPAGIKEQYEMQYAFYIAEHIDSIINGEDEDDDNSLVYDEVTNHPMTKRELRKRNTIRAMSEYGGWDAVKLMSQMNIGSKIERTLAKRKQKRRKKLSKKASSFFNDISGSDSSYADPVTSVEDLRRYLFED